MSDTNDFRPLSATERAVLDRLMEVEFPGREEIRKQLEECLVKTIDENGSLRFRVKSEVVAPVKKRIPVEAEFTDSDGVMAHVLLHVLNGFVRELEVYKDDSTRLIDKLDATKLRVIYLD